MTKLDTELLDALGKLEEALEAAEFDPDLDLELHQLKKETRELVGKIHESISYREQIRIFEDFSND